MSADLHEFMIAPAFDSRNRILLAPGPAAPWTELLQTDRWALAEPGDEVDVIICFDAPSAYAAKALKRAGIIHMATIGATWAGESADLVLFEPTPREFLAACRRAQRLAHARNVARDYATDILECTPDAFFVVDWDRRVRYQNPRALALIARFEGGNGDIRGEMLEAHVPKELLTLLEQDVSGTLRDAGPRTFELYLPSIRSWIEINVYFIPAGAGVNVRDITARKKNGDAENS